MKKAIILIMLLLCTAFVSAQFDIKINGKDSGITLKPNENADFSITIPANTVITDKAVKADNPALQAILNEYLSVKNNEAFPEEKELKTSMPLPATLPAGENNIEITIDYETDGRAGTFKKDFTVEIEGSKMLGFASKHVSEETMDAIMDTINPKKLPRINRDLTKEDKPDIKDFTTRKISTKKIVETKTVEQALKETESPKAKAEIKKLKDKETIEITKELNVYELTKKDTAEKSKVSKIIISAKAPRNLKNAVIIENIPKSVAENVKNLIFSEKVTIIQADPIVKWEVKHLAKDQVKEVSYTVDKELDSIESTSVAGGDKHSSMARLFSWIASLFIK